MFQTSQIKFSDQNILADILMIGGRRSEKENIISYKEIELSEKEMISSNIIIHRLKYFITIKDISPLSSENGFLSSENGFLSSENGYLSLENGFLSLENGFLSSENGFLSSENGFLSSENGFLSSENGLIKKEFRILFNKSMIYKNCSIN